VAQAIEFGTDGWRGIIADDFTYANVRFAAQGIAQYLREIDHPTAVIGYDTRFASDRFAREVAQVLAGNGIECLIFSEPAPTQVSSWTVIDRKASGAVVITASHNPYYFSGLKYKPDYGGSASPEVTDRLEREIAQAMRSGTVRSQRYQEAVAAGQVREIDPKPSYIAQLGRMVDLDGIRQAGLRILADPMYGSGQGYVRSVLHGGKTQVDELHGERNASFGGMHPEPIPHNLADALARMKAGGYDLAIANDGDADRVGIIDEHGIFINQLQVFALLMLYLLEKRQWKGPVVRSLTSTSMADKLGELFGVTVYEMPVGFKHLGPKMTETQAILAGEESGGFAFRGHIPERDGILSGLFFADMIVRYQKPLSQILTYLESKVGPHHYARHDLPLEREGYAQRRQAIYEDLRAAPPAELAGERVVRARTDDGYKFYLADGSWVLLRFSGTEPLIRIYSEAPSEERVDRLITALEERIRVAPAAHG
jgi:alpha-D-glucose phosphate-specific phosphoglucomutase